MDCSTACSTIHGVSQAKVLEWVPFPSPGDVLHPGIELPSPVSPALQVDSLPLSPLEAHSLFPAKTQNMFGFHTIPQKTTINSRIVLPPDEQST